MRKLLFTTILIAGFICQTKAQEISKHALGFRLGDNDGFGGEISYQTKLNTKNRLEIDLGLRNTKYRNAWKLSGIYQWVWNIDDGFNWYAGFGAGIGTWNHKDKYKDDFDDGLFVNGDGNIGIEYNFDIPLLVSIDFRPEFGIVNNYGDNLDFDLALSLRYQF
ncbi:hypothetical protein FF125_16325 [Aureibaculum algae]|uniref:Outer membrane protein beta-barrel domain-containing protein n=1 Tax=Aureibaculum algae TaxID=2584122 RepID=A0A5B7TYR2_9FLAO|nr:hypothetical protein [Aureibaculum algae]QCX39927.1 hypothetical protein FF125_16325 [Aureibaculum algae]